MIPANEGDQDCLFSLLAEFNGEREKSVIKKGKDGND